MIGRRPHCLRYTENLLDELEVRIEPGIQKQQQERKQRSDDKKLQDYLPRNRAFRFNFRSQISISDLRSEIKVSAIFLTRFLAARLIRDVHIPAARRRVGGSSSWRRFAIATIHTAWRQTLAVHGLFQNTSNFLRESPMLRCGPPPQRLLQVVGHIRANKYSLTICHLSRPLFQPLL